MLPNRDLSNRYKFDGRNVTEAEKKAYEQAIDDCKELVLDAKLSAKWLDWKDLAAALEKLKRNTDEWVLDARKQTD